ncbi:Helix-turn-helix domain-containing protein [Actinopolymorpha singaporensis]|uniref:Helix-turn-helix domain-containing protein n=1 Tax=Actinopolymorpha singaporensis TaxID=117157 RepID=A0A1H1LJM0_9ACTN|nr:Helix-turn-helix domain-containing protein [Actinopolymorpha singaporensis]
MPQGRIIRVQGVPVISSPYVCRLRLSEELIAHRQRAKMTHAQLAKATGLSQAKLSKLENGHLRPQIDEILDIAEALNIQGDAWTLFVDTARGAAERGWWEAHTSRMGHRQARYADLEQGASQIRDYAMALVPGLLQTEAYARSIAELDDLTFVEPTITKQGVVRGRADRQRMLRRRRPAYQVILDELVIRRPAVPRDVLAEQFRHLAEQPMHADIRVLPVDAQIKGPAVPKSAFGLYTYPEPFSRTLATVDNLAFDTVLTGEDEVRLHTALWERLLEASLPAADSVALLRKAADELTPRQPRKASPDVARAAAPAESVPSAH